MDDDRNDGICAVGQRRKGDDDQNERTKQGWNLFSFEGRFCPPDWRRLLLPCLLFSFLMGLSAANLSHRSCFLSLTRVVGGSAFLFFSLLFSSMTSRLFSLCVSPSLFLAVWLVCTWCGPWLWPGAGGHVGGCEMTMMMKGQSLGFWIQVSGYSLNTAIKRVCDGVVAQ